MYENFVPVGSKIRDFYTSFVNGLERNNNVECHIFKAVFKKLITRLAAVSKELRATENMVILNTLRLHACYAFLIYWAFVVSVYV